MNPNNPPSQQQTDPKGLHFRSIIKSFEVLIRTEQDPQKKNNCIRVFQKLKEFSNPGVARQLDPQNQRKLMQIRSMIKIYRNAFERITDSMPQYHQFKIAEGKVSQPLLQIQQKIDPKNYQSSYARALTLKKKEFGWTKQFVQDWVRAVEQQKKKEQQAIRLKNLKKNQTIKNQQLPQLSSKQGQSQVAPAQSLKPQSKQQLPKVSEKSVEKLPGQKPEKKLKKDDSTVQKPEKQKKNQKQKKQVQESDSQQNQVAKEAAKKKNEKQQRQKLEQRYEKPREPKNRVKSLIEYLQNRKQFSSLISNPSKIKEIAEFLNQNLQKFMKHHLTNLIEIAKLRNRKHQTLASSGNQFTYFSRQGYTSVKPITHLQVSQQPAKMLKINYRSKFQLYNLLRSRQEALQQSLLKQFASKKDQQTANKSDKKLWEYLLRPNQVIQKTENFVEMEESKTDRLSIEITHIRYLFQSHKFIRNSWLMMYCYNS